MQTDLKKKKLLIHASYVTFIQQNIAWSPDAIERIHKDYDVRVCRVSRSAGFSSFFFLFFPFSFFLFFLEDRSRIQLFRRRSISISLVQTSGIGRRVEECADAKLIFTELNPASIRFLPLFFVADIFAGVHLERAPPSPSSLLPSLSPPNDYLASQMPKTGAGVRG